MTLMQKRLYLKLTRNSFCIFFPASDIVSYREFISGPLHVRHVFYARKFCRPTSGVRVLKRSCYSASIESVLVYIRSV